MINNVNNQGGKNVFADRLKKLIAERKLSCTEVGELTGVSRQTIEKYVKGATSPSVDILYSIAQFFQVSADYLIGLSPVQTIETTYKAIHNTTGLHDYVIRILHGHKMNADLLDVNANYNKNEINTAAFNAQCSAKFIEIVNYFIKDSRSLDMILSIDRLLTMSRSIFVTETLTKNGTEAVASEFVNEQIALTKAMLSEQGEIEYPVSARQAKRAVLNDIAEEFKGVVKSYVDAKIEVFDSAINRTIENNLKKAGKLKKGCDKQ